MKFEEIEKLAFESESHLWEPGVKLTYLEGFNGGTNIHHHNVCIVTERKSAFKVEKILGRETQIPLGKKIIHTIEINCGSYGEAGIRKQLPAGTNLKEAKKATLAHIKKLMEEGQEFKQ